MIFFLSIDIGHPLQPLIMTWQLCTLNSQFLSNKISPMQSCNHGTCKTCLYLERLRMSCSHSSLSVFRPLYSKNLYISLSLSLSFSHQSSAMEEIVEEKKSLLGEDGKEVPRNEFSAATPTVLISTLVAVLGSIAGGWSCGYTAPAESGIMEEMGLSVAAYSFFTSTITIGAMIGSTINGRVTDIIGRRWAMCLSQLLFVMGSLGIALAKNIWWLDFGRLSIGIGMAFTFYTVPVYLAEITPKSLRGGLMTTNEIMSNIGLMLVFSMGTLLPWRTLALIGVIPNLAQILGLYFIPESPRWLAKLGREKELQAALQRLRGKNYDISQEANDIKDYTESVHADSRTWDLFQRKYVYTLTVAVGLALLPQFSGQTAIVSYANSIFDMAGFSSSVGTVALGTIQILSTVMSLLLVDKVGRRPLLLVSATGMGLSYIIVASSFFLQNLEKCKMLTPRLALIGILGSSMTSSVGMTGLPRIVTAEILPLEIKGSAGSLLTLANFSSAWIVTYTFNFLLEWNSAGTFLIYSGVSAAAVLFFAKLVPETRGRTLEGLQASLNQSPPAVA